MTNQADTQDIDMEFAPIRGTPLKVSRVAIGTWAIGGWMWGGTDEAESIATIRAALDHGINVIDTAPAYGFGRSEEIVGKAIAEGRLRSRVIIATKVGLEWRDGQVFRNASRRRIFREIEDSLRRLRTDHIDIYQVHWPDPRVTVEETAEAMDTLFRQGKIGAASRPTCCPIAPGTRSRLSATARCAAACFRAGCARIRSSMAMTCAARIRNFSSRDLPNILPRSGGSTALRGNASGSGSFIWRFAGCSTRGSPPHCGARGTPLSCGRSTKSAAGPLMPPSRTRSIVSCGT
jgi:hypothetical protein